MNTPDEHGPVNPENRVLFLLFLAAAVALGWILLPFYGAIMWGSIIALLFSPLHRRLLKRLNNRRTLSALLALLIGRRLNLAVTTPGVRSGVVDPRARG